MSPKLRSKMNLDDEPEDTGNSKIVNVIAIAMLVAIVVMGVFLFNSMQRSKVEEKAKAAAAARAATEQAAKDSVEKATQDAEYAARADSIAKEDAKHPKPKPAATAASGDAAGQPEAPPPPPIKFGIDVGSFLNQDRANVEKAKLAGATSLSATVVSADEDGGTSYHVVLGEFLSRKDAEKRANELIVAQTIREARVTKLK